jgi:catechol 2,3-dioxygenase-like lactoylglutathione lyase family enzyme
MTMISGAHVMIFTRDEAADRAFLRDVLEIPCTDTGGGWLIFKLPPTELGVHGGERNDHHELYFMSEHLDATLEQLRAKGVTCDEPKMMSWGRATSVPLPGGGRLGLYEPRHARP